MNGINQVEEQKKRAAFFIDGFNLYHAIDDLKQPHLKWVSYWGLANLLIPKRDEELVGVTWCTARRSLPLDKAVRHDVLVKAQTIVNVTTKKGHFVHEDRSCNSCHSTWTHPSEKEGDINLAIHLLRDAFRDVYDHAYLVTADSDQVATVKMFKQEFPEKSLTIVTPPGRHRSKDLFAAAQKSIQLNEGHLEKSVMPQVVYDGANSARRPLEYAPPAGWVHPRDRDE